MRSRRRSRETAAATVTGTTASGGGTGGAGAEVLATVEVLHCAAAVEGEQRAAHRGRLRAADDPAEGVAEPVDRADGGAGGPPLAAHGRRRGGPVRLPADLLDEPAPVAVGRRGVLPADPAQDRDPGPDEGGVPGDPGAGVPAA